jgi:peptidoglycan/LPS O-acetylase OafA/YrhL
MASDTGPDGKEAPPPRVHLTQVEGMRAMAALVVYVNHAYAQVWNPHAGRHPDGILSAFSYFLVAGHLSVTVFIVISGFCLTLPVITAGDQLRGGTLQFLKRRARRILPPYYGALALCLALIATVIGKPTGTLWDVPILATPAGVVSHLLLVQDLFATGSINYVFWSIAVEWQIYFLFPLLVWAFGRFGHRTTVAVALVVGYAIRIALGSTRVARANPHFIGMFALGMLGAYVARSPRLEYVRARQSRLWAWACGLGLAITVGLSVTWAIDVSTERFYVLDLPIGIVALSALVLSQRSDRNFLGRVFSWKPLVLIGTFSYSVYLIHAPLLQILWQYGLHPAGVGDELMFLLLLTAGLAVVLGGAYLFFRVFEQPFMRSGRPRVRAAVAAA